MDLVFATAGSDTPRLLKNLTTPGPGDPSFEDRTAGGDPTVVGGADVQDISWLAGWAADAAVDDFDGNGVHDLYLANHARTSQDELLLSQVSKVTEPNIVPWISGVIPRTGQTSGRR